MTLAYLQIRRIGYSCVATSAGIAMRLSEQAKWMVRNVCQANPSIRTAYPELFAVIGGKVPDYRGLFLRGQGGASDALGTVQNYAMPDSYGKGWFVGSLFKSPSSSADGKVFSAGNGTYIDGGGGGKTLITTFRFNLAGDTPTANEVRPINTAVRYFIRARP